MHDERTAARFWMKVDRAGPDDCWPWTAFQDKYGYGQFRIRSPRSMRKAHIIAFELAVGPTGGKQVCHSCDNPPCCNPGHLWLGTQAENVQDCLTKGRAYSGDQRGDKNPGRKLFAAEVANIKSLIRQGLDNTAIASLYGVHHSSISSIRVGRTWSFVE